jgi:transcriptional regulator GlxA family with amidase domain
MEKNFTFNMPMEKFGYLTGRSLITFKRDFAKAFNMTPQKWLTQKRLQLAHHQLINERKKPVEVRYAAGFENLSHFSFAFQKPIRVFAEAGERGICRRPCTIVSVPLQKIQS